MNIGQNQATAHTTEIGYFDLQAPLLCPSDITEPDDNYYAATTIQAGGTSVSSLFDVAEDEDWFKFNAAAGKLYVLQTASLASGVDTVLEIYDTDGVIVLASDDNSGGGAASRLEWESPLDGTYFIRIYRASGGAYECGATYELRVDLVHQFYLPLVLHTY